MPSRTPQTQQAYEKRGMDLFHRAESELGQPLDINVEKYLDWFEALMPSLKPSSRRQYIAALRATIPYLITGQPTLKQTLIKKRILDMQSAQFSRTTKNKNRKLKTSSQKAKRINLDTIKLLYKKSLHKKWRWKAPALIWLSANQLVGLRPIEWREAQVANIGNELVLIIKNAKNTNGRAHGKTRRLNLKNLATHEKSVIQNQLDFIKQHASDDNSWEKYYSAVRHTIYRLTREFMPKQKKYPSLYSSRHQFAANAKSAGYSKIEVAALMGHATDETATMHYGRKKHGTGKCKVLANQTDVTKIRINSKTTSLKKTAETFLKV